MKPPIPLLLIALFPALTLGGSPPPFMGDWRGTFEGAPEKNEWAQNPTLVAQVIGIPNGQFRIQLLNAFERRAHPYVNVDVTPQNGTLAVDQNGWKFTITDESFTGTRQSKHQGKEIDIPFSLAKITRPSPTIGRRPPEGAKVLIGDGNLDAWTHGNNRPPTWNILEDGAVEILPRRENNKDGGDLMTKESFRDCLVHLEFKFPYTPDDLGQARSNSGLFLQSEYEVQLLDTYGFEAGWTEGGSLYRVSPPKVNRSRPPEQWQTYDIEFRSAVFDQNGKLVLHPVITVYHNGELIHHEQELFEITQFREINRTKPHVSDPQPIRLQDHGNRLQFRNMWIKPLPPREAK